MARENNDKEGKKNQQNKLYVAGVVLQRRQQGKKKKRGRNIKRKTGVALTLANARLGTAGKLGAKEK